MDQETTNRNAANKPAAIRNQTRSLSLVRRRLRRPGPAGRMPGSLAIVLGLATALLTFPPSRPPLCHDLRQVYPGIVKTP